MFWTFPFQWSFVFRQKLVALLRNFVHLHIVIRLNIFQRTMTSDLLWKGHHIHISSDIFVISVILMNIFNSPYFLSTLLSFLFTALNSIILLEKSPLRSFSLFAKNQYKM